jgi:hydroxyacyl-ACP dehydratase HTD2-like protein with hotdog domain
MHRQALCRLAHRPSLSNRWTQSHTSKNSVRPKAHQSKPLVEGGANFSRSSFLTRRAILQLLTTTAPFLPELGYNAYPPVKAFTPGQELIFNEQFLSPKKLLADGTSRFHQPHPDFRFRLWAGGELRYNTATSPFLNDPAMRITTNESTMTVRYREEATKAVVKVRRHTCVVDSVQKMSESMESPDFVVLDDRWLLFSKDRLTESVRKAEARMPTMLPPSPQGGSTWSLTPNSALLSQFSALTCNSHAIHLDPEFTREVYGLPALLVQGSLVLYCMIQCLIAALTRHEMSNALVKGQSRISTVSYTNMAPLYVNNEIRIISNKVSGGYSVGDEQQWEVQACKIIDGEWRAAVKMTAKIIVQSVGAATWHEAHKLRSTGLDEILPEECGEGHQRAQIDAEEWWSDQVDENITDAEEAHTSSTGITPQQATDQGAPRGKYIPVSATVDGNETGDSKTPMRKVLHDASRISPVAIMR